MAVPRADVQRWLCSAATAARVRQVETVDKHFAGASDFIEEIESVGEAAKANVETLDKEIATLAKGMPTRQSLLFLAAALGQAMRDLLEGKARLERIEREKEKDWCFINSINAFQWK